MKLTAGMSVMTALLVFVLVDPGHAVMTLGAVSMVAGVVFLLIALGLTVGWVADLCARMTAPPAGSGRRVR